MPSPFATPDAIRSPLLNASTEAPGAGAPFSLFTHQTTISSPSRFTTALRSVTLRVWLAATSPTLTIAM